MNYLKNKIVYLCGPLGAVEDDGKGWRQDITPKLEKMGLIVDDPTKSTANGKGEVSDDKKYFKQLIKNEEFGKLKEEFWPIIRKDLRSVDKCDFLILNYQVGIPTIGTYEECTRAVISKKPILLKYDKNELDRFNPWVISWVKENEVFSNWNDLFDYLINKIDNRIFTSSRWTL